MGFVVDVIALVVVDIRGMVFVLFIIVVLPLVAIETIKKNSTLLKLINCVACFLKIFLIFQKCILDFIMLNTLQLFFLFSMYAYGCKKILIVF